MHDVGLGVLFGGSFAILYCLVFFFAKTDKQGSMSTVQFMWFIVYLLIAPIVGGIVGGILVLLASKLGEAAPL